MQSDGLNRLGWLWGWLLFWGTLLLAFGEEAPSGLEQSSEAFPARWEAGVARTRITPMGEMWLAGYASRTEPTEEKSTDLFAKALVLRDEQGQVGVVVTAEVLGIDQVTSQRICERLQERYQLKREQIVIACSHTHSGPVLGHNLAPVHYHQLPGEEQKKIEAYADSFAEQIVAVVGAAFKDLSAARLQASSGLSTFAVNRRNNVPEEMVPAHRHTGTLVGPVDHDVPVLSVRAPDGRLRAVLFGYACHATTTNGQSWSGDYPGFAQLALEKKHPGMVALFWAGCGGDQNPLPRRQPGLPEHYGERLAQAVEDILSAPMEVLDPVLTTELTTVPLPFDQLPTLEEIEARLSHDNPYEAARAKMLLRQIQEQGLLDKEYPFPLGQWTFGNRIEWLLLGGEPVTGYAVLFKEKRLGERTWVAGYCNDVMAYIPTRQVLREGGYEGCASQMYYGMPTLWHASIEQTLLKAVEALDLPSGQRAE